MKREILARYPPIQCAIFEGESEIRSKVSILSQYACLG